MDYNELLKRLTVEEKVALTSGNDMWHFLGIEKENIRQVKLADGPHGVRVYKKITEEHEALEDDRLLPSTMFPCASAMASTFNNDLIFQVGKSIGEECNHFEVDVLLAPGVNLKRSPLGGRNFEYYSEDPYLTGTIASSFINGVQSTGVGATVKHFALNEQETYRRFINSVIDERTLQELYLAPFRRVIQESNPMSIMSCYNQVNGDYGSESKHLLQDILRDQWNYEGYVVSDWGAVQDKPKSIKYGMNIEMPGPGEFREELLEAVKKGIVSEEELNASLIPLFVAYDKVIKNNNHGKQTNFEDHHKVAQQVSEEAIVLLENNGILPLQKTASIGVIGDFASTPRINGGGSATLKPYILENPLEELKKEFDVTFARGYQEDDTTEELLLEAIEVAKKEDIILFFTGTTKKLETEGKDRPHMHIPEDHERLFEEISKHAKKVIVVVNSGSAIDMRKLNEGSDALIQSWLLGSANAKALVDILVGKVSPSGRLSETFPLSIEHTPHYRSFPSKTSSVHYQGDITNIGYRYYDAHNYPVSYPFGYGLSYASFAYDNMKVTSDDSSLHITLSVTNTSTVDAKEVIQVYVGKDDSLLPRPKKELVAYNKVFIKAGETAEVTFEIPHKELEIYVTEMNGFAIEPGKYTVYIGTNVRDIFHQEDIELEYPNLIQETGNEDYPFHFFELHFPDVTKEIETTYRKIEWYEKEEPIRRVLRRLQRQYKFDDSIIKKYYQAFHI